MAIFGSGKKEKPAVETKKAPSAPKVPSNAASIIVECIDVNGDIKGCGSIHVDGKIHGNIDMGESIIVGKSGVVNGTLEAKKIIVSGKINGAIRCHTLEVTETGYITNAIEARRVLSDGKLEATITECEEIHITRNGQVHTDKMMSKIITINGSVEGNIIASELLEIQPNGRVKGEIQVKKIKVSEGGLMLGTMLSYEPTPAPKETKPVAQPTKQATTPPEKAKTKEK